MVSFHAVPSAYHGTRGGGRGVTANALVRAYRLGQQAVLRVVRSEIRASKLEAKLGLDIYELMAEVSFDYIDSISQRVVATYQAERDRWLENRNSLRASKVRELLAGTDVDVDAITTAIRYPLRRIHLAAILWCSESEVGDELASMERFVNRCAESIGAQESSLFISVDRVTAWAWIPLAPRAAADAVEWIRAFVTTDGPCVAVGTPLPGVEGFRHSHRQAHDARIAATASGAADRRFTATSDRGVSLAALLGGIIDTGSDWVREVLGPLASATEGDERLRDTLRVFLSSGSSYKAAAEELHLHVNSVKYRVARAVERRGRPITDDRLDVEVALLLCQWYDAALLV